MRKLDHCNIVRLRWFFYSSGEKVSIFFPDIEVRNEFYSGDISMVEVLRCFASVKCNPRKACYIVLFAVLYNDSCF